MALSTIPRKSVDNLWVFAAAQLNDEDRGNIDFGCPDKLKPLTDLHALTEKSKRECIKKRWKYTRKSGETVILRDAFDKIIRWIDIFKQVGDIAVQYDPIAVNDYNNYAAVVEGLSWLAELICRHAIVENLYPQSTSEAAAELERALIKLYMAILIYLSKAKHYIEQGSAKRILKSGTPAKSDFDTFLNNIRATQEGVDQCLALVDRHDQIHNHAELKRLLADTDAPLQKINNDLKNIQDNL